MPELSVLIPSRNEEFLGRTIDDVLLHARADTEVIAVLDGEWPAEPLKDHPRVRVTHSATVIGQRAATNLAARMSNATYIAKLDAHCSIDEGFDAKLIAAAKELGPRVTQIPSMRNLHAFNWRCLACGTETYQGPTPTMCATCAGSSAKSAGGPFEKIIYWDLNAGGLPGREMRTDFWRFDHDLHFQYHGPQLADQRHAELADVMSSVGACFFMRRERFLEIGGLDESHGSWGQFGTEIACKSWLSGGRHVVNKRTWFAHLFRTQGGDFSFPYTIKGSDQQRARKYSQDLWLHNQWPGQTRPLSWLLDHFKPIRGWHQPEEHEKDPKPREKRLHDVIQAGAAFLSPQKKRMIGDFVFSQPTATDGATLASATDRAVMEFLRRNEPFSRVSQGLVYYSDCRGDERILQAVREQIDRARGVKPLIAVTLAPIIWPPRVMWGDSAIVLPLQRGVLTMFRQILAGLEALDTEMAFLVEHDVLYHASHFEFTPPRDDTFYYNQNRWQVSAEDGRAVHYRASQTSGCCAYRALLVEHYRKRVAYVEAHGFDRNLGFEAGTNRRSREIDPHGAETWMSAYPNIDIRHGHNLSKTRWRVEDFRDKSTCQGWTEADAVPGWGVTKDRFAEFLDDVIPAYRWLVPKP